jgi:hypothetical protein
MFRVAVWILLGWAYHGGVLVAQEESPGSETGEVVSQEVVLRSTPASGEAGAVGEIDLGRVEAGSFVTARLFLKNGTDSALKFDLAKPTCSCAEPKIPAGSLAAGERHSMPSVVRIRIPTVRVKDSVLAEIKLFDKEISEAVAKLRVRATVERPFYIRDSVSSLTLNAEPQFEVQIPIEVNPDLELETIKLTLIQSKVPVDVRLSRVQPGKADCRITLIGGREEAIAARSITLQVAYEDGHWSIRDSLHVNFYDGTSIRLFPADLVVREGAVEFQMYRKSGFTIDALKCQTDQGESLDARFSCVRNSLVFAQVTIPSSVRGRSMLITDGDFAFSIPIVSESTPIPLTKEK